jgi:thioredoxin-like negative regulator of GroEL
MMREMPLPLAYVLAAGFGVLIAHYISRAPELRAMRLSQLVLIPLCMVASVYARSIGGLPGFVIFLVPLMVLVVLLAPNIAHHIGWGLMNFLEAPDWTPTEEEIALRPIRKLIDRENYRQALGELDELLKNHKPTYEAVLLRAKLLNHIGRTDETVTTLLSLIALSNGPEQQMAVMENLFFLEQENQTPPVAISEKRRFEIYRELMLFQTTGEDLKIHKEIPPGWYQIEAVVHRNRRWLKLVGEDWGNDERCWEAISAEHRPVEDAPKKSVFAPVVRFHESVTMALRGKSHRQLKLESQKLFDEAKQFIRKEDWPAALPLLEKASQADPDRYEIAYRWLTVVRQTGDAAATAKVLDQVLAQSQWTENEEQMLRQLAR